MLKVMCSLLSGGWEGRGIDALTCIFLHDGNCAPVQARICISSCMNALERSHKCRWLSFRPFQQACVLICFLSHHKSSTPNRVITGLAVPNLVTGTQTEGPHRCSDMMQSALWLVLTFTVRFHLRGGRHHKHMVWANWREIFLFFFAFVMQSCWAGFSPGGSTPRY